MRVAFITYEFPPDTGKGGIGTYTLQMASLLAKYGFDVHVFAGSFSRECSIEINNFKVHWVKYKNQDDFCVNVLPFFRIEHVKKAFDIIESAEIHGNAREIKRAFPLIPLVIRLHAPNWLVESLKKRYIPFILKLRFLLGALRRGRWDAGYWKSYDFKKDPDYQFTLLADSISAPSNIMRLWAVKNWKLKEDGITILPNPFTPPRALVELEINHIPIKNEILFFGRLNVLKGLVNGTLAMRKILKEFPDYWFKVIGDDGEGPTNTISMRHWMKVTLSDVKERVIFLDGVPSDQISDVISEANIALLPSLFESFSYTCAELMASGKAIVASKNTGMSDLIEHNVSGLLVDVEHEDEIYFALKELITNNDLRYNMSLKAREGIIAKFSEQNVVQQFIQFYKSVELAG